MYDATMDEDTTDVDNSSIRNVYKLSDERSAGSLTRSGMVLPQEELLWFAGEQIRISAYFIALLMRISLLLQSSSEMICLQSWIWALCLHRALMLSNFAFSSG